MPDIGELVWVGRDGSDRAEHIARHGVSPDDVEEAVFERRLRHRWEGERLILFGQDRGGDYIAVILEPLDGDEWLVISARRASEGEKRRLRSGRK